MFWVGMLAGIIVGFIFACAGQNSIEKSAIQNGCIKLNGKMFEIIPWKSERS